MMIQNRDEERKMDVFQMSEGNRGPDWGGLDNSGSFQDPSLGFDGMMQDKITTKQNAKGEIQAEVRIGGILTTNKDIDEVIGKHLHAWTRLKQEFPNLVKPKPEIIKVSKEKKE